MTPMAGKRSRDRSFAPRRRGALGSDERGQAFTLEAFIGAILILSAVVFALNATVITPTTGGGVEGDVLAQLRTEADDVLQVAADNGSLTYLARNWDPNDDAFRGNATRSRGYVDDVPPTGFGALLNGTFAQRGRSYSVLYEFRPANDSDVPDQHEKELLLVHGGFPTQRVVVATHTVTLYDDMTLVGTNTTLATARNRSDPSYPIPDAYPDSPLFNVLEVRLVVWV